MNALAFGTISFLVLAGAASGLASLTKERWAACFPTVLLAAIIPEFLLGAVDQLTAGRIVSWLCLLALCPRASATGSSPST